MTAESDASPIIANFETGTLKSDSRKRVNLRYVKSDVANKKMLLADTGALTYGGPVIERPDQYVRYYVGVVDKKTRKIEDVQACRMCTLKPMLNELKVNKKEKMDASFREKSDSLVAAFGSAKQKRLLTSRKKNEDVNSTISDKVVDIAKDVVVNSPKVKQEENPFHSQESADIGMIPPSYPDATSVEGLYHVDDIIDFRTYKALKVLAQEVIEQCNKENIAKWMQDNTYPLHVLYHLKRLPDSQSEKEEKVCYLIYLHCLIMMHKLLHKDMRRKDMCPTLPVSIKPHLLERFTKADDRKNRTIPSRYKDKILCHILVLSLIVEKFELNCNFLMKDLKLTNTRITKYLRAVGCNVKTTKGAIRTVDENEEASGISVIAALSMNNALVKEEFKIKKEEPRNVKTEE